MNKNVNLMKLSPPYVHGQVGGCKSTSGVKKKGMSYGYRFRMWKESSLKLTTLFMVR